MGGVRVGINRWILVFTKLKEYVSYQMSDLVCFVIFYDFVLALITSNPCSPSNFSRHAYIIVYQLLTSWKLGGEYPTLR